jgi:hypothetical protein
MNARSASLVVSALLVAACQAPLPPAALAIGHGLERVWVETLGLE